MVQVFDLRCSFWRPSPRGVFASEADLAGTEQSASLSSPLFGAAGANPDSQTPRRASFLYQLRGSPVWPTNAWRQAGRRPFCFESLQPVGGEPE